jgi:hypothetical protein
MSHQLDQQETGFMEAFNSRILEGLVAGKLPLKVTI